MNEEGIDKIEENIEDLPQEVKDFIFGHALKSVKDELAQYLKEESDILELENNLDFFLIGSLDFEELVESINKLKIEESAKTAIKTIVQEKIFNELILLIKANEELENTSESVTENAPSPADLLARLNQNKITPTVFDKSKKERGEKIAPTPLQGELDSTRPEGYVDPYREIPEV